MRGHLRQPHPSACELQRRRGREGIRESRRHRDPDDAQPVRRGADHPRRRLRKAYGLTLAMADAVRAATHLQVFVALGPYPVEFIRLRETLGDAPAVDTMTRAIDLAAKYIREGKAVAFGEVGRPHFPVGPDIVRGCNGIVAYAMAQAKGLEC